MTRLVHSISNVTIAGMDSHIYTTDTSPEAHDIQLDCLRKMSPQQRLEKTFAFSRQIRQMAFAAIRRRHPEMDHDAVQLRFIQLTYGQKLANEFAIWKAEQA